MRKSCTIIGWGYYSQRSKIKFAAMEYTTTVEIIDEVTQKSQESSERIVQLVDEASEVGRETNGELVRQGEQLRGVKRETEDIREDLKDVEEQVSRLECFTCGLFRCSPAAGWWRRRRKRARPRLEFNEDPVVPPAGQQTSQKKRRGKQYNKKRTGEAPESPVPGQGVLKGSIIRKVTNDEIIDANLRYACIAPALYA